MTEGRPHLRSLEWLQPRDPGAATKVVAALGAVGVVVSLAFLPLVRDEVDRSPVELGVLAVIAAVTVALVVGSTVTGREVTRAAAMRLAWAMCPFLGIAVIVTIDLATFDASLAAQIFFLFPTLYGATLLPRPGAILVLLGTLLGEYVVVWNNLASAEAIVDAGYMSAALIATTAVLVQSSSREAHLRDQLERSARTDPLTGLANRRAFDAAASWAVRTSAFPDSPGTALVLLDIDFFKSINDQYGHPAGDDVLVQLAELVGAVARDGDVVSRLGGDEIAVLMAHCGVEVAQRRAQEMVEAVRAHGFVAGVHSVLDVTISAGLAHCPSNAASADQLYEIADTALYEAKRAGRNRLATYGV